MLKTSPFDRRRHIQTDEVDGVSISRVVYCAFFQPYRGLPCTHARRSNLDVMDVEEQTIGA